MKPIPSPDIYQLKVTLLGTRPPIWRRLLVPAKLNLAALHQILQIAIGWQECHMHEFRVGETRYGTPDPENRAMGFDDALDERKTRLADVLGAKGAKAVYTYDFGDGWEHSIVLEKILQPDPKLRYPLCIAGKLSGPPEDCGGVGGYYDFLEAIADPAHPEHESMIEWIGGAFDPEAFPIDEVNALLSPPSRRRT